ncbi:MAG TPA: porin [Bryobacteraceae bacterium]|nr:porin [Bryobacteraceae bacterium]
MHRYKCAYLGLALVFASAVAAQTPPADSSAAPTAPPLQLDISGYVDGYYSYNLNHPASRNNTWRNFDVKHNSLTLNFAKLTVEKPLDTYGFKLELAAGRAMDIFHASEPGGLEIYKHVLQAYVSMKKGVQLDFGKFVTSAGAEPTETHLNWNYSRSLLFTNGPYYHFGARTTIPVNANFSAGFQLVNGWNNVEDNNNSKTVGFTTALTTSKINWFNTYYVGNEKTDTINGIRIEAEGVRHFYDTVVALNPNGKVSGLINFDYGQENNAGSDPFKFYAVSVAARALGGDHFAISPRYDWYKDRDGFITGASRTLQEFTLTGDWKLRDGFLTRFEYRRDWASTPFYDYGNEVQSSKDMNTFLIGFVFNFGPARIQ